MALMQHIKLSVLSLKDQMNNKIYGKDGTSLVKVPIYIVEISIGSYVQ